jgi:hypothetical protein
LKQRHLPGLVLLQLDDFLGKKIDFLTVNLGLLVATTEHDRSAERK